MILQDGDVHTSALASDTDITDSDNAAVLSATELPTSFEALPQLSSIDSTTTELGTMTGGLTMAHMQDTDLLSSIYSDPLKFPAFLPGLEIFDNLSFDSLSPNSLRAFQPRQVLNPQISLNRRFVICTLRSYPGMMLSRIHPPPFIHPKCLFTTGKHNEVEQYVPGSLATCSGIVSMFSVKNKENSVFIWRAVRMEQERIAAEASYF